MDTYDILLLCHEGFEHIASKEVEELTGKSSQQHKGYISVSTARQQDMAMLAFYAQSIQRILITIGSINYTNTTATTTISSTQQNILRTFIPTEQTFAASITKQHEVEMSTPDLAAIVGGEVVEYAQKNNIPLRVQLKQPNIHIHGYANDNEIVFGIDIIGFDMSKRPYKVVNTPNSLNGSFAYCVLREVAYEQYKNLLDPFCHDGILVIEAALHTSKRSTFFYEHNFAALQLQPLINTFKKEIEQLGNQDSVDKHIYGYGALLKTVKGAQKNAKIAGVHDKLLCSKVSIDWIDAKFEEGQVECIVTYPPQLSKRAQNTKDIAKIYDELLYQSKYLLAKKGVLAMLMHEHNQIDQSLLDRHLFEVLSNKQYRNGGQVFTLYQLRKK